jgi:hypothetical protein
MVSVDHFRQELLAQMGAASSFGEIDILITSVNLCRALGGYPGTKRDMSACCDAMQDEMRLGDVLLVERASAAAAGMTVCYLLPR